MTPAPTSTPAWRAFAPVLRVVLYAAFLVALFEVLVNRIPAPDGWAIFGEYGRLETAQVAVLVVGLFLACFLARREPSARGFYTFVAGVVICVIVREHNNFFKDHVFHGAWEILVTAVLVVTLLLVRRARGTFLSPAARFVRGPGFAWVAAALVCILVAQRLDKEPAWQLILGSKDVPYTARRVVEESFELVAYALATIGLFEDLLGRRRLAARADQSSTGSSA